MANSIVVVAGASASGSVAQCATVNGAVKTGVTVVGAVAGGAVPR